MGSGFGQNAHLTQELVNAAWILYVDAGYAYMSEEILIKKMWYTQKEMCVGRGLATPC